MSTTNNFPIGVYFQGDQITKMNHMPQMDTGSCLSASFADRQLPVSLKPRPTKFPYLCTPFGRRKLLESNFHIEQLLQKFDISYE